MKYLLVLAAAVAALSLTATASPARARHHHHARWHDLSLTQKRAVVAKVVTRERQTLRWWLANRERFPASSATPHVFCAAVGIRAPGAICIHADRLVKALHVQRRIDAKLAAAKRALVMRIPLTNDWLTAVAQVQRVFPGSAGWLIACSSSEGGHGGWVWNGGHPLGSSDHGSGAGGWMQYMEGTFWGDYRPAVADARARGFIIPAESASYTSATGQALAGGWAYSHNRPAGKWTGGSC